MDLAPLTPGAVEALSRASKTSSITDSFVLQILSVREIAHTQPTRYFAMLSDGIHYFRAALSQNVVQQYGGFKFSTNSVVGVDEFTWSRILFHDHATWLPEIAQMHTIAETDSPIGSPMAKSVFPNGG
ncbi:hypothetical protein DFH06DRAFT_1305123 [Mycena polygramma]|nr:hypothetical protein DFH06DRAFT_1305123 [Mycena polygramma]